MSGEALGWALKQSTGDANVQHVLLLLALRADEFGAMTEIDADYLAERACIKRTTVFRCLKALRELGLLETATHYLSLIHI